MLHRYLIKNTETSILIESYNVDNFRTWRSYGFIYEQSVGVVTYRYEITGFDINDNEILNYTHTDNTAFFDIDLFLVINDDNTNSWGRNLSNEINNLDR